MDLRKPIHIRRWLIPISWLYGFGVNVRNKFFKWGIFKRKSYDIPIICVGNISVGGTGKTPHTEYLIRLLKDKKYKVAVLSRGYKRKTNGFILSTIESTCKQIGDEPYQIKQKFPDVAVAVDKKRTRGIEKLLELVSPDVIILDDGFQHRYVKPSYSIVLSDFNRPVYEDELIPAGRLREPIDNLRAATDIIVTKCAEELQPIDFRIISRDINPFPYQGLFFSKMVYGNLEPIFGCERVESLELDKLKRKSILLVTGIASPKALLDELFKYSKEVELIEYKDHYKFTKSDLKHILSRFKKIKSEDKIIIVTEKDATKLRLLEVNDDVSSYFYYIPIEITFLTDSFQEEFNKKILKHVEHNKRGGKIY